MYADETHLTYANNDAGNIESCLSEDLLTVYTFLKANKLTLNMTKTEFMLRGSGQRLNTPTAHHAVTMDSTRVKRVLITKSFGVTIGAKLSFLINIKKNSKKNRKIFFHR